MGAWTGRRGVVRTWALAQASAVTACERPGSSRAGAQGGRESARPAPREPTPCARTASGAEVACTRRAPCGRAGSCGHAQFPARKWPAAGVPPYGRAGSCGVAQFPARSPPDRGGSAAGLWGSPAVPRGSPTELWGSPADWGLAGGGVRARSANVCDGDPPQLRGHRWHEPDGSPRTEASRLGGSPTGARPCDDARRAPSALVNRCAVRPLTHGPRSGAMTEAAGDAGDGRSTPRAPTRAAPAHAHEGHAGQGVSARA